MDEEVEQEMDEQEALQEEAQPKMTFGEQDQRKEFNNYGESSPENVETDSREISNPNVLYQEHYQDSSNALENGIDTESPSVS